MPKVTIANLDAAVMAELDRFAGMMPEVIEKAQKAAAKAAIRTIKAKAPGDGEYARGWKQKTEKTRTGVVTTVYQGEKPGLPHLLEFGHAKVNGGRTRAFPHIAPAETEAMRIYEDELTRGVEDGA